MIAGPNGSGKTTLTRWLRSTGFDLGEYINADDIAAELVGDPAEVSRTAQRLAEEARQSCLARGVSFAFETVMSHPSKVEFLKQAKTLGYFNILFFVGVEDPRINVDRVAQRVAEGGHDVPTDRIVHRYERTMALLPQAVYASDRTVLFDNSYADPGFGADFEPFADITVHDGKIEYMELRQLGAAGGVPEWSEALLLLFMSPEHLRRLRTQWAVP